jgi:XTP/dITP diphosphohydrolase
MNLIESKIVLASNNTGKLKEFQALLSPLGMTLVTQSSLHIEPAPEPFDTFLENALAKARHASQISGLPSLADDSGICVNALNGSPGIHSARFAGPDASDAMNNQKLLHNLRHETDRRAKYVCVLVFLKNHKDPQPLIAMGQWHGKIIDTPLGSGGFGYDPYFYLPDLKQTAAQLDVAIKNQVSHRALAMQELLKQLQHD